jgi:phenylacetate-CoA ligase
MAPSLPVVLAEWARTPLDVLLKQPEGDGGACEPLGARQRALELAQLAEARVPAFRRFLAAAGEEECGSANAPPAATSGAAAAACQTWEAVPFSSKQNYVQRYPLEQRCAGGALPGAADFLHCSSGSSGEPTLWARNAFDELAVCTRWGGGAACCICAGGRLRCRKEPTL